MTPNASNESVGRGGRLRSVFLILSLLILPIFAPAENGSLRWTPLDEEAPYRRLLWVTRWDYRSPKDIEKICYNAASARFTDLLFQVRGEGTVFFESPYEPWAWELSGKGPQRGVGVDPGWDPLAVAIAEGRRRGLRVHAYVNVMPAWAQDKPPSPESGQLYASRKSWLMVDARGRRITPRGFYACLDPGIPEVREYLARLFARLVNDYAVDGVHLDYIRYPHESGDYSYHPRVLEDFRRWYGKSPSEAPKKWILYRQRQVTATVREIRKAINRVRPGVELTAAVLADPEIARVKAGQDALRWLREGLVDAIAPMVYVEQMDRFDELAEPYLQPSVRDKVWMGIRFVPKNHQFLEQIRLSASKDVAGISIFSYEGLFPGHKISRRAREVYQTFVGSQSGAPGRPAAARVGRRDAGVPHKRRKSDTKVWVQ